MKSKDISSRAKLGYGHICLREENFSFDKQLQDLEKHTIYTFMQVVYGTASARARWRICTSYVNGNLGLAVGRLFVKETFRETAKNDVSKRYL
jgi:predicted metalloendopeptidase